MPYNMLSERAYEEHRQQNRLAEMSASLLLVMPTADNQFSAEDLIVMQRNLDGAYFMFSGDNWYGYRNVFEKAFTGVPSDCYDADSNGQASRPVMECGCAGYRRFMVQTTVRNAGLWDTWNASRNGQRQTPTFVRIARLEQSRTPLDGLGYFISSRTFGVRAALPVPGSGQSPLYYNIVSVASEAGFAAVQSAFDRLTAGQLPDPSHPWPLPHPSPFTPRGPLKLFFGAF